MAGVNKAILIGNLGRDPEIRYTPAGAAVANFSIATSEKWKDKETGESVEKTEWHRIVSFNRLAEICGEYLSKGSKIFLEGKLQTRSWEKDGVTRYTTEIVMQTMTMLGGGQGQDQGQGQSQDRNQGGYDGPPDPYDDDIPF